MSLEMGLGAQKSAREWELIPHNPPLRSESTQLGKQARHPNEPWEVSACSEYHNQASAYQLSLK